MGSPSAAVAFGPLFKTAVTVALVSAVANAAVWFGFRIFGPLLIGVVDVVVGSVVGVLAATIVFAMLGRWTRRPRQIFVGVSVAVLVLYALGPVSAALAPYKEGAPLFNVTTVLATELMHLVSGLLVLATFPKLASR